VKHILRLATVLVAAFTAGTASAHHVWLEPAGEKPLMLGKAAGAFTVSGTVGPSDGVVAGMPAIRSPCTHATATRHAPCGGRLPDSYAIAALCRRC
jgi:hypothetical protein